VHPPVNDRTDIFSLLTHQDPLQEMFTGGTVVHVFIGEAISDWRMVRDLARKIVTRFKLPYFSLTPTFSICPVHGYVPGECFYCPFPHTDEEIERFGELLEDDDGVDLPEGSFRRVGSPGDDPDQGRLFLHIGRIGEDG